MDSIYSIIADDPLHCITQAWHYQPKHQRTIQKHYNKLHQIIAKIPPVDNLLTPAQSLAKYTSHLHNQSTFRYLFNKYDMKGIAIMRIENKLETNESKFRPMPA